MLARLKRNVFSEQSWSVVRLLFLNLSGWLFFLQQKGTQKQYTSIALFNRVTCMCKFKFIYPLYYLSETKFSTLHLGTTIICILSYIHTISRKLPTTVLICIHLKIFSVCVYGCFYQCFVIQQSLSCYFDNRNSQIKSL